MNAIEVRNVSKTYVLYEKNSDVLLSMFRKKKHLDFQALKNISFNVEKGITFGIVGRNGSGKSTILKIITETSYPTSGGVKINGKVALLNVSGGIVPGFTGIENIYYKCKLMGLKKSEIDRKLASIIEFSELEEFIEQPVKKYSSGMMSKLGFAIAIHIEPEILIVDEALAVGDSRFQEKCMNKMNELKAKKTTIVYVSHAAGQVEDFCDRALFLDHGEVVMEGEAAVVAEYYKEYMERGITEDELALKKQEYLNSYQSN